jgi:H+/Cl- antiporter ClcA
MNASHPEEASQVRSWWSVWLFGAVTPLAVSLLESAGWQIWVAAHSDLDSANDWISAFPAFIIAAAIIAFFTAAFFVFIVRVAENRAPKPLLLWLALGLIAATPIALAVTGFTAIDPFDREERTALSYVAPLAYFYIAGLIGALTAWRVRRGRWRA